MRIPIVMLSILSFSGAVYGTPFIVAHRGASAEAPENTLPAFELAWEQGADAIEGDFFLTADNHIVCIHDPDTKKVSDQKLVVAESTLEQLQQLDVGLWKGMPWKGTRIPTLANVLKTVPEEGKIFIEIKCGPEILPVLEKDLEEAGLRHEQIVIISFNADVISGARERFPDIKASWLTGFRYQRGKPEPNLVEVLATLQKTGATGLGSEAHERIDGNFVEAVLAAGFEFHVWTVNEPHIARRFARMGAQSITTDVPGLMKRSFADF